MIFLLGDRYHSYMQSISTMFSNPVQHPSSKLSRDWIQSMLMECSFKQIHIPIPIYSLLRISNHIRREHSFPLKWMELRIPLRQDWLITLVYNHSLRSYSLSTPELMWNLKQSLPVWQLGKSYLTTSQWIQIMDHLLDLCSLQHMRLVSILLDPFPNMDILKSHSHQLNSQIIQDSLTIHLDVMYLDHWRHSNHVMLLALPM